MKLSGTATISHPVGDVYAALTDPAVLVRTLPGCQRLELVGQDTYTATLAAGVGSIKGLFDADVRLTDQSAPESFTLHASGTGVPGTVDAVAHVRLVPDAAGGTVVHYTADATVGGVIGGVGQRMLAGVARRTANDFFAAVDHALTSRSGDAAVTEPAAVAEPAAAEPAAIGAGVAAGAPAPSPAAAPSPGAAVWTRPAADSGARRVRDLVLAASFGAGIALLGVLIGALVAGW